MRTLSKSPRRWASCWRYEPMNDYFFYKIMGEKGMEVQLLGFLNAVLGRTANNRFTSVEILENKTFTPETIGKKSTTFDVRAVLQGGARVNVEVQIRNRHNMDRRSLFHWGREYVKSLKAGDDYRKLPDVIAVNVVNFNFPPMRHYHTCFHLREDKEHNFVLTNSLEIHFLNMVKYRKAFGIRRRKKDIPCGPLRDNPLARWLAWFNSSSPPELITEVKKMDSAILAADDRLAYLSGSEDEIRAYELRFTALCDQTTERNHAIETGFAKGMKKGKKEGLVEGMEAKQEEIARNALAEGASVEFVQKITGLDMETINKLEMRR